MDELTVLGGVLVAMLLSLPVIVIGLNSDMDAVTVAGAALLGAASLVPPATRFIELGEQEHDEEES